MTNPLAVRPPDVHLPDYIDADLTACKFLTPAEKHFIIGLRVGRINSTPRPGAEQARPQVGQIHSGESATSTSAPAARQGLVFADMERPREDVVATLKPLPDGVLYQPQRP